METQESKINPVAPQNSGEPNNQFSKYQRGRSLAGLVIIAVGGALLARQLGLEMPYWVFSWGMFWVVVGIFIGVKHNFRNPVWIVPTVIGTGIILNNYFYDFSFTEYFWPILIIGIGLVMLFKTKRRNPEYYQKHFNERFGDRYMESDSSEDVLDCVTIFGGVKKNVISKNFRGGEAITFFGGVELNLMQADTESKIVLDMTQVFGGTKLIIPPHWKINAEDMVTIFGGMNDKRPLPAQTAASDSKVIILKGTCIFGGIDIKSY